MKVPFFSLEQQVILEEDAILNLIKQNIIAQQAFIGGNRVTDFEQAFARYISVNHAISCNSGTDALWIALKTLGIEKNHIVLTTPFSFIASSSEIVSHNAHPVFIDIDPMTYNIDPLAVERWLIENTIRTNNKTIHKQTGYPVAGILGVNIFGQCADWPTLNEIAQEWHLWTIEDACQSIAARCPKTDKLSGSLADISCFSFYPTKNLGAWGDAGMCTTNNAVYAEQMTILKNHGRLTHYNYTALGINSRMDSIQAELLLYKLSRLAYYTQQRKKHADSYITNLKNISNLSIKVDKNTNHVYHQFAVEAKNSEKRHDIITYLTKHEIGTTIFYPKLLSTISFLQTDTRLHTITPVAETIVNRFFCLPIWPELSDDAVAYICRTIQNFFNNYEAMNAR